MNCPACTTGPRTRTSLAPGLFAQTCTACDGIWLSSSDYWAWRQNEDLAVDEESSQTVTVPTPDADSRRALICPDCGHILLRYRIGGGLSFNLDHCGTCNGVWFDRDEWQAVKSQGLHHKLPHLFGEAWQRRVWMEERQQARQALFEEKFGAEDYAEIKRIRAWLEAHPERAALLAYLNDPEPESAATPYAPLQINGPDPL